MTYFNPKVYCKENLTEEDRKELDWWAGVMINAVQNVRPIKKDKLGVLEQIQYEEVNLALDEVLRSIALTMNEIMISCIDNYDYVADCEIPTDYCDSIAEYLEAGNDKKD